MRILWSAPVIWDVRAVGFSGSISTGRSLTGGVPTAAFEGVWPLMTWATTQTFCYRWSALSRSCITPKSSHWCPNDCFPSNLPAQEKQDTSPSSCHIVICCNFYPGNARLIWLGLDNLSFRHLWSSWPPGILFYKREMMDKTANF